MSICLYMDVHVRRAVSVGLQIRRVDVLTAQRDGATRLSDPDLLERASALGRVLFSQDRDLLRVATARQRSGTRFSGLIYAHPLRLSIRQLIEELELIAKVCDPVDCADSIQYLPLR